MARALGIWKAGFAAYVALAACAAFAQTQATGKVGGEIRFSGVSPSLANYLGSNAAVARDGAVRLIPFGGWNASATTGYVPVNSALSPTEWKAATYSASPPVADPGGTIFTIEVNSLSLSNGATYRFGNLAGAPGAFVTPAVLPLSVDPAGPVVDIAECAALATVRLTFSGPSDALAALGDGTADCYVSAAVEEFAGSGTFNDQAWLQGYLLSVTDMKNPAVGASLAFPVRAAGLRVKFKAQCSVAPAAPGFELNTGLRAEFSAENLPQNVGCGAGELAVAVDIPVRLGAGSAKGSFDFVGMDEEGAGVTAHSTGFYQSMNLAPLPSNQPAPLQWAMEGVRLGSVIFGASAGIQGGSMGLVLPPATVTVDSATPVDFKGTFVAKPLVTAGTLFVVDGSGHTGLAALSNSGAVGGGGGSSSYVQATGRASSLVEWPPGTINSPAGNANGGYAYGRLEGSTAPAACPGFTQGCTTLSYRLPMSGRSNLFEPLTDGSNIPPTRWDVGSIHLFFGAYGTDRQQWTNLAIDREMAYVVAPKTPGTGPEALPPALPNLGLCVGQVEVEMRAEASAGTLFAPSFWATGTVTSPVLGFTPKLVRDSSTSAQGAPSWSGAAASSALVVATVPEGAQYDVYPSVNLLPSGGAGGTYLSTLPMFRLPPSGTLACGQVARGCLKINDAGGNASQLTVNLASPPACAAGGGISAPVSVQSGGAAVDRVDYAVDGVVQDPPLCVSCGTNPALQLGPLALAPGNHVVSVTATANGCSASSTFPVTVPQPVVACPADFSVMAGPGETSIAPSDPRIAGQLQASVTGACGVAAASPQLPAAFPVGEATSVPFIFEGSTACATRVSVTSPRRLLFFDGGTLKAYNLADGALAFESTPAGGKGRIVINPVGGRIAVVSAARIDYLRGSDGTADGAFEIGKFTDFSFRPGFASDFAAVQEIAPGAYMLQASIGGSGLLRALPAGIRGRPRVAWAADGATLGAAWVQGPAATEVVQASQWTVLPGPTLSHPPLDLRQIPVPADTELFTLRHLGANIYIAGTTQGVYAASETAQIPIFRVPFGGMDLHRLTEAWGLQIAMPAPQPGGSVVFLLNAGNPPAIDPALVLVRGVAVSDYDRATEPLLAVTRTDVLPTTPLLPPWHVSVYRYERTAGGSGRLVLERRFEAADPGIPAFLPAP